jgi:predicted HAD superfamily phosphohydrolase YqeG
LQAIGGLELRRKAMVVVGDKDLTDGLLARRAGARFIKVRRKLDPADRLSSRMANLIDLVFGPPAVLIWDAFSAVSIRL